MAKQPDDIVAVLYGSKVKYKRAVAFCKYHHCHLTVNQIKRKECLNKQCRCLDRILSNPYWARREKLKLLKREAGK